MLVKASEEDEVQKMSIFGLLQSALKTFLETCKHEKLKLREFTIFPYQLINIYISQELQPDFVKELQKYAQLADFSSSSKWYPLIANIFRLLECINLDVTSLKT